MRKMTSLILALAFIIVAVTGVQLDLAHGGREKPKQAITQSKVDAASSAASAPRELRQPSFYPKTAHEWSGYLFIVAGCVHLVLNLRAMKSYLGIKR
jgi:hypothetical protein